MSDEIDSVGKALDRVDSLRRRTQVVGVLAMVLLVGLIGRFGHLARTTDDLEVLLRGGVELVIIATLATGFMVCAYVTHMTQRIVLAIHVASERPKVTTSA